MVTFFILGDLDGSIGGFGDAAFSTLDQREKRKKRERGNKGWHGLQGEEEHVQYSSSSSLTGGNVKCVKRHQMWTHIVTAK